MNLKWSQGPPQLYSTVRSKKRQLVFQITYVAGPYVRARALRGGKFLAFAIETVARPRGPEAVFNSHGHQYFGTYRSFEKAATVCLKNATLWLKQQKHVEQCACKNLKSLRRSRKRRA